jgi:hypothetical protein
LPTALSRKIGTISSLPSSDTRPRITFMDRIPGDGRAADFVIHVADVAKA